MTTFTVQKNVRYDDLATNQFIAQVYKSEKSNFLIRHGAWWYRGEQQRFAVVGDNGQVVGHSAVIPSRCLLEGHERPVWWWVDLIVDPAFRGRGFQTWLDDQVRAVGDLKFAFPARDLSAKMFQKHGWSLRRDCWRMTLPLSWRAFERIRLASSLKGRIACGIARLTDPAVALWRWTLARYQPANAYVIESPDAAALASVFDQFNRGHVMMTVRDAGYIQWRYLDAPYRDQLVFYAAGLPPRQIIITRALNYRGIKIVRILDVFGDLGDKARLHDMLRLVVRDSIHQGAEQVTAIASLPELVAVLRRTGFWMRHELLFCWHIDDPVTDQAIGQTPYHITFADSDADTV